MNKRQKQKRLAYVKQMVAESEKDVEQAQRELEQTRETYDYWMKELGACLATPTREEAHQ